MNTDSLQVLIDSLPKITIINPETSSFSWELLVAFAAVIVGPLIQLKIAKNSREQLKEQLERQNEIAQKQIHANTVTANRKEWINSLRETVAEYISESTRAYLGRDIKTESLEVDIVNSTSTIVTLQYKIEFLLNPKKEKSIQIKKILDDILSLMLKEEESKKNSGEFGELSRNLALVIKEILKEEWERVKSGE